LLKLVVFLSDGGGEVLLREGFAYHLAFAVPLAGRRSMRFGRSSIRFILVVCFFLVVISLCKD
jgi:hypothetical protein